MRAILEFFEGLYWLGKLAGKALWLYLREKLGYIDSLE